MTYTSVIEKVSRTREQATKTSMVATSVILALLLLSILVHFLIHPLKIPAQAAMYVDYGRLISEGQAPYVDFFDLKGPLIMYLCWIPNKVSAILSIHPILTFNICVWILLVVSVLLTALTLFKSNNREQGVAPYLLVGFVAANLFFIEHFGQVHHLFMIFTLPYFVSRILSSSGHDIDVRLLGFIGIFASLGFGLDILFVFIWVIFEVCLAIEKENLRVFNSMDFNLCMVGLILIGMTLFTLLDEVGMRYSAFPLTMMFLDYDAWNGRLVYFNTTPDLRNSVYFMIIACVLAMCFRKYSRLLLPMVVVSVLGFGVLVIQGKMYSYQTMVMMIPSVVLLAVTFGVCVNWMLKRLGLMQSKIYYLPIALAAVFAVYYIYQQNSEVAGAEYISLADQGYQGSAPKEDLSMFADYVLKNTKASDNILVVNDQAVPAYPLLLQLGRKQGSGFLCTRLLKVARRVRFSKPPDAWAKTVLAENQLWERLKSDISSRHNEYIFFNKDSMGPALDEKQVTHLLDVFYEPVGYLEWHTVEPSSQPEYLGYKTSFHIYKLK